MAGILTRDEIVTEVCDIVGKGTAGASVSGAALQTRVRVFLNWAQRRVARMYSFDELNTLLTSAATVADIKIYPLISGSNNLGLTRPKDIYSIRAIISSTSESRKLERWSPRKFDEKFPDPTLYSSGVPWMYIRYGNDLELFRIPDAVYTLHIRYPKWPTDFSTGGQTSDYTDKDEVLVAFTVMETYLALQEYTDVAVWYPRCLGLLKDAIGTEENVDWEPKGEPFSSTPATGTGSPWIDPSGTPDDPLYGYID